MRGDWHPPGWWELGSGEGVSAKQLRCAKSVSANRLRQKGGGSGGGGTCRVVLEPFLDLHNVFDREGQPLPILPTHPRFYAEKLSKIIKDVEYLSGTPRPEICTFGMYCPRNPRN